VEPLKQKSPITKDRSKQTTLLPYKTPDVPVVERAGDRLSRRTFEEKAVEMMCIWQQKAQPLLDSNGNFDLQKAELAFKGKRGPVQVGHPIDARSGKNARGMAELTNAIQNFFLENRRPGIPVVFHEECLSICLGSLTGRARASIPAVSTASDQRSQK